jgi:hypothetical protein
MTKRLDPAIKFQRAEERICICTAVGSGEGHEDWCPWTWLAERTEIRIFGKIVNDNQKK